MKIIKTNYQLLILFQVVFILLNTLQINAQTEDELQEMLINSDCKSVISKVDRITNSKQYTEKVNFQLANCYAQERFYKKALLRYNQLDSTVSFYDKASFNKGKIYFTLGQYDSARFIFQALQDSYPHNGKYWEWTYLALQKLNVKEKSRAYLDKWKTSLPKDSIQYYYAGNRYYQAKDFPKAVQQYNESLSRGYKIFDVVDQLSKSFQKQNKLNEAIEMLESAKFHTEIEHVQLNERLIVLYHSMKNYEHVIKTGNQILEKEPQNVIALGNITDAYFALKKYQESFRKGMVWTHHEPLNYSAWFLEGISAMELGYLEQAEESFGKSIQLNPAKNYLYYYRGIAKQRSKDLEGACKDFLISSEKGFAVQQNVINKCKG